MFEDLYAKPDLSRKVPAQPQEMERETTADDEDRNEPIYDNNFTHRSTEDMVEEPQKGSRLFVCPPHTDTHTHVCTVALHE